MSSSKISTAFNLLCPLRATILLMTFIAKFKKRFYFKAARYFKFFANISLKKWHPRIIIITGSAGKTTMLNLIESQMSDKAHYSHDANSIFGISFDILGMTGVTGNKAKWLQLLLETPIRAFKKHHEEEFYIVEADAERPHEAEMIAKWLKPEISLWISLGRSHAMYFEQDVKSGKFDNIDDAIADAFAMIPRYTKKLVYIDADNSKMVELTKDIKAEVRALSKKDVKKYEVYPNRAVFKIGDTEYQFHDPLPEKVSIQLVMLDDLLKYLGIEPDYTFEKFEMPPGRGNYFKGKKGINIIDSSYNAHVISMATILDFAHKLKAKHKWLVIGDIVEQGSFEEGEHKKLAQLILDAKPEHVILVGRRCRDYVYPVIEKKINVESFAKPQDALEYIQKNITGEETLIFKGSQYLEWIIEKLLKNPDDVKKLCRQDLAHKKRRESWGLK